MNFLQLPKIDLHCHLDGSVRPQTVIDLATIQGTAIPSNNVDDIKALMVAPESCPNLNEYLTRFALPVSVMQTEAALERISFELFEDAAKENVKYLEVRFGPQLHRQQGLNFEQIIGSVVKGMRRAEAQYDIKGNYILSIIKVLPKDDINDVIDAGAKFLDKGVVAFDLAASEEPGFCHEYIPYAKYALEKGYRITIHAGEQGVGQNVYDAIALLGAERIGHGIHINNHQQAYDLVRSEAVALETCPSSNVQTKAVESLASHPFGDFYRDGLLVTINTDNRTVSDTTMTKELQLAVEKFNLTEQDYFKIYQISAENSFASDEVKQHLLTFIG
ncbi:MULTISPECIES: adenosine deaminase [Shewanella]|uniref:Adenosine deaminase n=1 Tax=Shewanella fidelis TaxID=173509 RepID=A0AAW8NHB5_9GAMM|nr:MULTISPECIES: adenosine deaminase [Shewanella]MDR8522553.1 adenosine deaminase [Shewanella fidelis]MDW4812913.1 adenosine deaminase [Shewanella fidelis]MDW4816828.1 adenosine deaminase [Shewanella fidelis]MDW4820920.1 adenosine deaminase [Shewanella fidelis]MDW4825545.1 adenosine deaminase [Shewanella fidelis]